MLQPVQPAVPAQLHAASGWEQEEAGHADEAFTAGDEGSLCLEATVVAEVFTGHSEGAGVDNKHAALQRELEAWQVRAEAAELEATEARNAAAEAIEEARAAKAELETATQAAVKAKRKAEALRVDAAAIKEQLATSEQDAAEAKQAAAAATQAASTAKQELEDARSEAAAIKEQLAAAENDVAESRQAGAAAQQAAATASKQLEDARAAAAAAVEQAAAGAAQAARETAREAFMAVAAITLHPGPSDEVKAGLMDRWNLAAAAPGSLNIKQLRDVRNRHACVACCSLTACICWQRRVSSTTKLLASHVSVCRTSVVCAVLLARKVRLAQHLFGGCFCCLCL
jgi:hypothetical protein